MDERFRCKLFLMSDFVIDSDYPKLWENGRGITLRGINYHKDFRPDSFIYENADLYKSKILETLSEFWKWEGFKDDFKVSSVEIFKPVTTNEYLNGEIIDNKVQRFIFRKDSKNINDGFIGYDIFLDYQIWERDEFTFLKVNHADDCFVKQIISDNEVFNSIHYQDQPYILEDGILFKGFVSERSANVDDIETSIIEFNINNANNQVLKFLNEKFQSKKPELVDLGNNVYEVRG